MKIARIGITHHRLDLDPPLHAGWDSRPRAHFDAAIVRVETDEGHVGVGSGDAMPGFAGHEALFIGHDPLDLKRHWKVIDSLSFHYGRCWPLDLALWDLAGKIAGKPCYRMMGGRDPRLQLYASSATLRRADEMAALARRYAADGFGAMKVRFHRPDWRQDLNAVIAIRAEVGEGLDIMVDCNQGWRMPWDTSEPWDLEQAAAVAAELEAHDVYWMEEPLHRGDYHGMAQLRERTRVRVAAGEMAREVHDLRTLMALGSVDVVQPDAALAGGITGLIPVARRAAEAGLGFSPHTWTNGVGLLANAHLSAGCGASMYLEYPFDPPEWTPERRDFMLAEPLRAEADGCLVLPERPGLGAELDEERLARTRI